MNLKKKEDADVIKIKFFYLLFIIRRVDNQLFNIVGYCYFYGKPAHHWF